MSRDPQGRSFGGHAVAGSLWGSALYLTNKVLAFGSAVVLGWLLDPQDYGMAGFAVSALMMVTFFPVWGFADLMFARPGHSERFAGTVQAAALAFGLLQSAILAGAGLVLARWYPDRPGLQVLCAIFATRPLLDAFGVVSVGTLLGRFRYREFAKVETASAVSSSVASILMAWLGWGAVSVVASPSAGIATRAAVSWPMIPRGTVGRPVWSWIWPITRRFVPLSTGNYVQGVAQLSETAILAASVPPSSVGLFVFAFGLSAQVVGIISNLVSSTVVPILGHLKGDAARQAEGFDRASRLLAAVVVPFLLAQACVAGAVFEAVWPGKWTDAVVVFRVLSIGQVFQFSLSMSQYMMKAQGRFALYAGVNAVQAGAVSVAAVGLVVVAHRFPAFLDAGWWWGVPPEARMPVGVAAFGVLVRLVLAPGGIWLACRPAGWPIRRALGMACLPAVIALLPMGTAWWVVGLADAAIEGRFGRLAAALSISLAGFAVSAALTVMSSPATRMDAASVLRRIASRIQ
jgi:O-antigen/teichoic acid export membrane protein